MERTLDKDVFLADLGDGRIFGVFQGIETALANDVPLLLSLRHINFYLMVDVMVE